MISGNERAEEEKRKKERERERERERCQAAEARIAHFTKCLSFFSSSGGALKRGEQYRAVAASSVVDEGAWESCDEREKDRGWLQVADESERERSRARRPIRERKEGATTSGAARRERRKGGGESERVHVFSTSTQPGWRRIAAQCSSNGAALRRDHAAAPCATDRPISGTRERIIVGEKRRSSEGASSQHPSQGGGTTEDSARAARARAEDVRSAMENPSLTRDRGCIRERVLREARAVLGLLVEVLPLVLPSSCVHRWSQFFGFAARVTVREREQRANGPPPLSVMRFYEGHEVSRPIPCYQDRRYCSRSITRPGCLRPGVDQLVYQIR
ncbi:hypothetical protein X777_06824 [Ooceraea biroi]|uniref:Uncharacterized protein n=1 Tax=Ooceraea biroi TaxID=2015173 RepID=A0A026WCC2_OOCBI|nr:hypothetical protein X777_06824 [Ooceraea biroi]